MTTSRRASADEPAPISVPIPSADAIGATSAPALDEPIALLPADAIEVLTFPWRAVQRHRKIAIRIAGSIVAVSIVAAIILPRHYIVETKMTAERNVVLPALGNPRRSSTLDNDAPTRLAAEAVLKRDNLDQLISATDLMSTWASMRSIPGKVSDLLASVTGKRTSEADKRSAMIGLLRERIWVRTDEGTIVIGVDWNNAQMAYQLVQTAQQNFIEQRQRTELAMIEESIAILQQHSVTAEATMEAALQGLRRGTAANRSSSSSGGGAAPRGRTDVTVTAVQASLADKERAIAQLEATRNARRASLQTRLAELQRTYGPAHPEIAGTRESLAALIADTSDLRVMHDEETVLRNRLARLGVSPLSDASAAQAVRAAPPEIRITRDSVQDPDVVYAMSRLKMATSEYEDLLDRLQSARIEQETARAAFKYRFTIVTPAEVPRKVSKPKVPLLLVGGLMAGLMFAVITCVILDLLSGVVIERWQLSRQLGLPLLADLGRTP